MISVSGNGIITLCRGDDAGFAFTVPNWGLNGEQYSLGDGDTLYVGVMEPGQPFEDALIRKALTKDDMLSSGEVWVPFASSDTINLLPGAYYIQMKLRKYEGVDESGDAKYSVDTVLGKSKFFIVD